MNIQYLMNINSKKIYIDYVKGIKIKLSNGENILKHSNGEILTNDTINYRTLKPEKGGLFSEQIFGPMQNWTCACGKYKKYKTSDVICDKCNVKIVAASVRRDNLAHVNLIVPVVHIWYFRSTFNFISILTELSVKDIERIIYYTAYVYVRVDSKRIEEDYKKIEEDIQEQKKFILSEKDAYIKHLREEFMDDLTVKENNKNDIEGEEENTEEEVVEEIDHEAIINNIEESAHNKCKYIDELFKQLSKLKTFDLEYDSGKFQDMLDLFGEYLDGDIGAIAVRKMLMQINIEEEIEHSETILSSKVASIKRIKYIKRLKALKIFENFNGDISKSIILDILPVLPAGLRPMVPLEGGRFGIADVNELYRRIINRNKRLGKLIELNAPKIIINNECRMLQESVDALFDNGRHGKYAVGSNGVNLKSLSDTIKGKYGRFRQNLLGKRVDYSARSVIVVNPSLQLNECAVPKKLLLDLFYPFMLHELVSSGYASSIKHARYILNHKNALNNSNVLLSLENVIKNKCILLNRAPTLHKLSIQAFDIKMSDGGAIGIHPMVCAGFNADFDGDQMAVHLPISIEAQIEARGLMMSSRNLCSVSTGKMIVNPTHDMVVGIYYLSGLDKVDETKKIRIINIDDLHYYYTNHAIALRDLIHIRLNDGRVVSTTYGRYIINKIFPSDYPYINEVLNANRLIEIISDIHKRYSTNETVELLENIKELGFKWCTKSCLTIAYSDFYSNIEDHRKELLNKYTKLTDNLYQEYLLGLFTTEEFIRTQIEYWTEAIATMNQYIESEFNHRGTLGNIILSGARGNIAQLRQIVGIRGLVVNARNSIIPHPIKSNFSYGLSPLEYFISTHGSRKGLTDTALRTADSGYLTRKLVDVCQNFYIVDVDCGTKDGLLLPISKDATIPFTEFAIPDRSIIFNTRYIADDIYSNSGDLLVSHNTIYSEDIYDMLIANNINSLKVRSPITCETKNEYGICSMCYGYSVSDKFKIQIGSAIGIIAAQSIGEPGTQLTMQTFHSGGVSDSGDITHGLPRVTNILEVRSVLNPAILSPINGTVEIGYLSHNNVFVSVIPDSSEDELFKFNLEDPSKLVVENGDKIVLGTPLTKGLVDINNLLDTFTIDDVRMSILNECQRIYQTHGVFIHSKHFELIISMMSNKSEIIDSGKSDYVMTDKIYTRYLEEYNSNVENEEDKIKYKPVIIGMTRLAFLVNSWLSASSFQETTRVLSLASISESVDSFESLKANVIMGKLIPIGTGYKRKIKASKEADLIGLESLI